MAIKSIICDECGAKVQQYTDDNTAYKPHGCLPCYIKARIKRAAGEIDFQRQIANELHKIEAKRVRGEPIVDDLRNFVSNYTRRGEDKVFVLEAASQGEA